MDDAAAEEPLYRPADLAAVIGLAGVIAGVLLLRDSDLGAQPARAIDAVLAWVPVTSPPALIVLLASLLVVVTGASLGARLRGRPYDRLADAVLEGIVLGLLVEVLCLALLSGAGAFRQPVLLVLHAAVIVGSRRNHPIVVGPKRWAPPSVTPLGVLVVVAWAAPVVLMLASPVVPFLDVLPNHVAPAEHLRTFGALGSLDETWSPIYGPSRSFVGYTALLGSLTTMTGLPAGQALAAFILPSTILVALAVTRLARVTAGPGAVTWVLLAAAMTTTVARLGDARATVVVLPVAIWVLAGLVDDDASGEGRPAPLADRGLPGLGLGAAILVHPVIGFLAVLTLAVLVLGWPRRFATRGLPALAAGGVLAIPQAATMLGVGMPPIALGVAVAGAIVVGVLMSAAAAEPIRDGLVAMGRLAAVVAAVAAIVFAGPVVQAAVGGASPLLSVLEVSLVAVVLAMLLRAPAVRSPLVWAGLAAGFGVAALTQLVPEEGTGLLGSALRFELPKTLQYWVPVFVAVPAGAGLAALAATSRVPEVARTVGLVAIAAAASLPVRSTPIDAFHLGEHRLSETLSIALRWAERGFWQGYPDSRWVVDTPRQALLDAVRAEIDAGRIGPETPVLHVAGSFQQWVATPLGVFDGVAETDVTPDAEVSIHTVGGRLHPLEDVDSLLASRAYPYLLFEPDPDLLPADLGARLEAAGYGPIFANEQGTLYRLAP